MPTQIEPCIFSTGVYSLLCQMTKFRVMTLQCPPLKALLLESLPKKSPQTVEMATSWLVQEIQGMSLEYLTCFKNKILTLSMACQKGHGSQTATSDENTCQRP